MTIAAVTDPVQSAAEAGLRYVSDVSPGITRKRAGKGFTYLTPDGERLTDKEQVARIKSLAIPPAWRDVWISPSPRGHIQATGRDERGRKQYRYHPRWHEVRDEAKYGRMIAFGQALPRIRERVEQDLRRQGLPREKVLATVVRLLDTTLIRVGNTEYARENRSFGLTTMRDRHAEVGATKVTFHFRGKSGLDHEIELKDRRLAGIVKRCQDLPGQDLFQYVDEDGGHQPVTSDDVNAYLREIAGEEFTAKDFRTWAGTVLAAQALAAFEQVDSEADAKRNVVQAIESVAKRLGNTRAICRKCYVHPAVIDAYLEGHVAATVRQRAEQELSTALDQLPPEEAAVLMLLHQRVANGGGPPDGPEG